MVLLFCGSNIDWADVRKARDVVMNIVDELKTLVGPAGWTTDPHELEPHLTEWRETWRGNTRIMVSPDSADKVAEVVRACRRTGTAIVPQGRETPALCGGAIPDPDGSQVLLSLSRMNRVRRVSADDHSMVVEAGCTLADVQGGCPPRRQVLSTEPCRGG